MQNQTISESRNQSYLPAKITAKDRAKQFPNVLLESKTLCWNTRQCRQSTVT
jgi:hypothetical protein